MSQDFIDHIEERVQAHLTQRNLPDNNANRHEALEFLWNMVSDMDAELPGPMKSEYMRCIAIEMVQISRAGLTQD